MLGQHSSTIEHVGECYKDDPEVTTDRASKHIDKKDSSPIPV